MQPGENEFAITRVFNAPRELLWKAHSEAGRLAQWWGPKGFAIKVVKLDFRPGGVFHYLMESRGGNSMWGRFIYREIVRPERIVFVNSFSDPSGGITRAPFDGPWPLEMLNTLTLAEQGGKTTLVLRSVAINATEEEQRIFKEGFASMQQGYGGTLDQLAEYLEKA